MTRTYLKDFFNKLLAVIPECFNRGFRRSSVFQDSRFRGNDVRTRRYANYFETVNMHIIEWNERKVFQNPINVF